VELDRLEHDDGAAAVRFPAAHSDAGRAVSRAHGAVSAIRGHRDRDALRLRALQVGALVGHPDADIRYLLLGYPIVFALYLASGFMRVIRYGSKASNVQPIIEYLGVFVALLVLYVLLRGTGLSDFWLNCTGLLATLVATRAYRYRRRRYSEARKT
jgi:hypothetical protein